MRFLLRRLVYLSVLVVISTSAAYVLAATQLNPRSRYEGRNPPPPAEVVDAALDALNMNDKTPGAHAVRPLGRRARLAATSGRTIDNTSVNDEIEPPHVGQPAADAGRSVLGTLLGVAAGAYGAVKQYRLADHAMTVFSFVILSMPVVVLGGAVQERRHRPQQRCSGSRATRSCSTRPARSRRASIPGRGRGSSTGSRTWCCRRSC